MYTREIQIVSFIRKHPNCTIKEIAMGIKRSETVVRKWLYNPLYVHSLIADKMVKETGKRGKATTYSL